MDENEINFIENRCWLLAINVPVVHNIISASRVKHIWIIANKNSNTFIFFILKISLRYIDPIVLIITKLLCIYSTRFSLLPPGQSQAWYVHLMRYNFMLFIYIIICSLVGLTLLTDYARVDCHMVSVPVVILQTFDTYKSSFGRHWVYQLLILNIYIKVCGYKIHVQPRHGIDSNHLYRLVRIYITPMW